MADASRRAFFKHGLKKISQTAVSYADKKVNKNAALWFRPPFAVDELDFILLCTRCNDCVQACPHQVIFPLPAKYGATVVNTPVMDLLNKACHLCPDWPCVTACESKALAFPEVAQDDIEDSEKQPEYTPPKLAQAQILQQQCLPYQGPECGACRSACPVPGALQWDMTRPIINLEQCCGCALCRDACITQPAAIKISHLTNKAIT